MKSPIVAAIVALLASPVPAAEGPSESPTVPRPAIVSASEWGSKPQPIADARKQTPKYVTIHHAGVLWEAKVAPVVFVRNMQSWGQKEKGWPDLPYHFLIAPDGTIFEGRPPSYEPESNTKYPLSGNIGVEMMGDFGRQRPDPRQIASCVKLTAWLCHHYRLDPAQVRGHKDAAPGLTDCPGKDFDRYLKNGQLRRWVEEMLAGNAPAIDPGPPLPDGPTKPIPATVPVN
ncbi:N-acetylmuramoyl-L-alanine amidase [Singulisphaera sp. GP187]|uniref:peptidoglycan recognition protein family protein n=1 Tax=Singulisphaera sp. GP187 TaxID=1882752 RepID=UPI0009262E95|nr:peptidoglycan recognition family protein [Singulisphaera sp. GP187]SIO18544.1 N-acetylmuramoyl-L-alanine amidase [Singulisphaera sp. GP187]